MGTGLQEHLRRYGGVALAVYFAIFAVSMCAFALAVSGGIDVGAQVTRLRGMLGLESSANTVVAQVGTWGLAYGATKLLQPVRIALTLILTPWVARVLGRVPAGDTAP